MTSFSVAEGSAAPVASASGATDTASVTARLRISTKTGFRATLRGPLETSSRLSGDAAHFKASWDSRRVPDINFNKEQTAASMQRLASIMAKETSQLWINDDKAQRDKQKLSLDFYE